MAEVFGGEWAGDVQSINGMNIPFWVRVTNSFQYGSITLYAWIEIQWVQSGSYPSCIDLPSPRSGTTLVNPFFEPNNCPVPIGSIAKIERAYFDGTFQNIYVASYIKPCSNMPVPIESSWYCLTPPEDGGQWYCAEPPDDTEQTVCCPDDPLPTTLYMCFRIVSDLYGCYGGTTEVVITGNLLYTNNWYFDYDDPSGNFSVRIYFGCVSNAAGFRIAIGGIFVYDNGQSPGPCGGFADVPMHYGGPIDPVKEATDDCDPFLSSFSLSTISASFEFIFKTTNDPCA